MTTQACGTRRTASSTTSCRPTARRMPLRVRSMVGLLPLCRGHHARAARSWRGCPTSPLDASGFIANQPRVRRRGRRAHDPGRASTGRLLVDGRTRAAAPDARADARRAGVPLAHGLRALSRRHRDRPFMLDLGGAARDGRLRAGRVDQRPVRRQLQLARAGLVPASTTCSSRRCGRFAATSATTSSSSTRPAPGVKRTLAEVADELARPADRTVLARLRRRAGRCSATTSCSRPTRTGTTCSGSTSTSTATPAPDWAPRTRPAGPDSLRRACCTAPTPLSKSRAPDHGERPDTLSRCPPPRNRPAPP